MNQPIRLSKRHVRTFWWAIGVLCVGFILTYMASIFQERKQAERLQIALNNQTKILIDQTQRRINLYISTLRSGAEVLDKGHYESFEERFVLFCQSQRFQNSNTGINEIGFIPAVSLNPPVPQNVITHLCSVQDGVMVKNTNDKVVNPALYESLHQPIGEGQVLASPVFELSFRPNSPKSEGQIFYYPIGNYDAAMKTKMLGNPKLVGWLFLTLRKSYFAERMRIENDPDLQVRLEMVGISPAPDVLIYETGDENLKNNHLDQNYHLTNLIPVAGRFWRLSTGFKSEYVSYFLQGGREAVWIAGIAFSLLMSFLTALLYWRYESRDKNLYDESKNVLNFQEKQGHGDQHLKSTEAKDNPESLFHDSTDDGITIPRQNVEHHSLEKSELDFVSSPEAPLWDEISHDPITKLVARPLFLDRLNLEIGHAHRNHHSFGLIGLSIDNIEVIQNAYGAEFTNQLLQLVGNDITTLVRSTDTVGYLKFNYFVMLITQLHDIQHLTKVAYKILEALNKVVEISNQRISLSVSMGLSAYPEDGSNPEILIEHSFVALDGATQEGGNQINFYSQPLAQASGKRRILVQEIRKAIDRKQLVVRFQPVLNLQTGKVVKAEALIRWESPEHGEIKPQEFIAIAEDAGLILEIGNFVFSESVSYLHKWRKVLPKTFQISINLSPQQLRLSKQLPVEWLALLKSKQVHGESIVLEITEGLLLQDDRQIMQSIYELRDAGILFCLDDFGTGYSSIAYLKKLNIDYLKIDQSFVRDLNNSEQDRRIVEGILLLAKKLNIQTIAEGIETKQQLEHLRQFGCEFGQGFYFARAMLPDEFLDWAKERFV